MENGDASVSARILPAWSCVRRSTSLLPKLGCPPSSLSFEGWVGHRLGTEREGEGVGWQDESGGAREAISQLCRNGSL